jgi:integrase
LRGDGVADIQDGTGKSSRALLARRRRLLQELEEGPFGKRARAVDQRLTLAVAGERHQASRSTSSRSAIALSPQVKCAAPTFDFYDATEAALLVASAREDERTLILFALHTGARAGEQIALEWTDIDTRAHKHVSLRKSRTNGVTSPTTKSGKPRTVPLSATLEAALKPHRHMKGPLVFCQDDGRPLTLWHLHGALDRAARRAQLRRLRWHDLRHSFASNLTIGGTPIRQVQEWMGHSTILMTMRYSHLAPGGGREHPAALDAPPPIKALAAAE